MIKVAVMGFGTIGSGVVEVLSINKESIAKRVGDTIEVKYVFDVATLFPASNIAFTNV